MLQRQYIVRGDDDLTIRFNALRFTRTCTYCEQNVIGCDAAVTIGGIDLDGVRIHKGGAAMDQVDVITAKSVFATGQSFKPL